MEDHIKMLESLSEKTKAEIELFVTNSFLSDDEYKKRKFYEILRKVMVESLFSTSRNLKK
jgi:hypothetical protein